MVYIEGVNVTSINQSSSPTANTAPFSYPFDQQTRTAEQHNAPQQSCIPYIGA